MRFELITQNVEEVLTPEDLKKLIENKEKLVHYIGFEISGYLHLGSGLMTSLVIRDLIKAGVNCQIFLADWHSWINDKLGGDLKKIQKTAVSYYQKAFRVIFDALDIKPNKVDFILGSELYHHNDLYWQTVIDVAKNTTLNRALRSIDIMGRKEGEVVEFAKLIYPMMQVADIFALRVNLPHGGTDQRKAHVIARDIALNLKFNPLLNKKKEKIKPVAIHHHILLGGQKPVKYPLTQEEIKNLLIDVKMSKSKPETAIFIHDSPKEIETKVIKAFCPPKDIIYNPVLDWMVNLILPLKGEIKIKTIKNQEKVYKEKKEILNDYQNEIIHPMDLKEAVIYELTNLLEPIYKYFKNKLPKL